MRSRIHDDVKYEKRGEGGWRFFQEMTAKKKRSRSEKNGILSTFGSYIWESLAWG